MRALHSGGTTLARPRRLSLLIAAGAVIATVALVVMLLSGDENTESAGSAEQTAAPNEPAEPAETTEPGAASLARNDERSDQALDSQGSAAEAARELTALLRSERLWSTVTIDRASPNVVIIRSSLCEDDGLQELVTGALSQMKSHGVAAVRCLAPHGGEIFEKTP